MAVSEKRTLRFIETDAEIVELIKVHKELMKEGNLKLSQHVPLMAYLGLELGARDPEAVRSMQALVGLEVGEQFPSSVRGKSFDELWIIHQAIFETVYEGLKALEAAPTS